MSCKNFDFVKIVQRLDPRKVRGPRRSSEDEKDEKQEMWNWSNWRLNDDESENVDNGDFVKVCMAWVEKNNPATRSRVKVNIGKMWNRNQLDRRRRMVAENELYENSRTRNREEKDKKQRRWSNDEVQCEKHVIRQKDRRGRQKMCEIVQKYARFSSIFFLFIY